MDSVKIFVFAVSLILMLDGLKAQTCNPCINYQVKSNTLPPKAASILNQFKGPTCNRIGNCSQPSIREKVSKCAVYQGDGTLSLGEGQSATGVLEVRKCEEVSAKETNGCTPIRVEDFNEFLSVLPEEASTNLRISTAFKYCLNIAQSGASHFKNSDSRNASMFVVVLVLAMFPFDFES
ncbi:uncharacterized protein LOC144620871 [Crassostrea virginica]